MTRPVAAPAVRRRARRHDPGRRDRLVDTAIEVIARDGAARTSHRSVAAAADVPLGSITYHFATIDQLILEAFAAHAEAIAGRLEARLLGVTDPDAALEALTDHVHLDLLGSPHDVVLSVELYLAAARTPALRTMTQRWMQRSRTALSQHFDAETAREVDALVEGLVLHSALSTDPMDRAQLAHALRRLTR